MYAERIKLKGGAGDVEVPTGFSIAIPIYERQKNRVKINCFLNAEVVEGKVMFSYDMDQIEEIQETVVDTLIDEVVAETNLEAFYGSPALQS